MRYVWCKQSGTKGEQEMRNYKEAIYRREFENAMTDNRLYSAQMKKAKRFRSAFTTEQINYLEKEFHKYPYIGNARRKDVSIVLNIPERAVKIWFQNRRMKEKKETPKDSNDAKATEIVEEQLNSTRALSSNDPYSLPLLTANDEDLKPKVDKTAVANDSQQAVTISNESLLKDKLITAKPDCDPTSTVKNAASSSMVDITVRPQEDTIFSNEKSKMKPVPESKTVRPKQEARWTPMDRISPKSEQIRFNPYLRVPFSQDMSSHSKTTKPQPAIHPTQIKSEDSHIYLKGFYAQPYLPPNMVWKPINVAPVMPTALPTMTIPNNVFQAQQSMPKRSCNCDCHSKPYVAPMHYQQGNSNPHVQYVITAVPFQSPKF